MGGSISYHRYCEWKCFFNLYSYTTVYQVKMHWKVAKWVWLRTDIVIHWYKDMKTIWWSYKVLCSPKQQLYCNKKKTMHCDIILRSYYIHNFYITYVKRRKLKKEFFLFLTCMLELMTSILVLRSIRLPF